MRDEDVIGGREARLQQAQRDHPADGAERDERSVAEIADIRPRAGRRYHPESTLASDRVGLFDLWQKLLSGDSTGVLSRVGWPVAPLFIADFDRADHFWGGDTGAFDANGDNV
ncbi:MAG: hypothetical protein AB7S26_14845 [Sandaracinaceae bacterium]